MTPTQRAMRHLIVNLNLFAGVKPQTLDYLAAHFVELRYRAGACIWMQSSEAFLFAVVLEGEIEVIRGGGDESMTLYLAEDGEACGFASLFVGSMNDCTAVAHRDTVILATSGEVMRRAAQQDLWLHDKIHQASEVHQAKLRQSGLAETSRAR